MSGMFLGSLSELRATGMLHPFQCLLFCTLSIEGSPSFLLAASRSRIFVFSSTTGDLLSTWQSGGSNVVILPSEISPVEILQGQELIERPSKRRKKASSENESESSSAEIVTEDGHSETRKSNKPKIMEPHVITVVGTSDGQSVVAVTDEDKCVRVLKLDSGGKLQQLSQRQA